MQALSEYRDSLIRVFSTGEAMEHAYRPALHRLLEGLEPSVVAINEPKHRDFGAVDFLVLRSGVEAGWVETKDIGTDLNKAERTEQMRRYLGAFPSLLLTDYLDFRWYVDGELRLADRVAEVVQGKIKWNPIGAGAVDTLLRAFITFSVPVAATPNALAVRMASLAQIAQVSILGVLRGESEKGKLHSQMQAFRTTLLPDLSEDQFADMYAQTVAYGLFAARCNKPMTKGFSRGSATLDLPETNPFLREVFEQIVGVKLHGDVTWVVDRLAALLASADMSGINKALGKNRAGRDDPVVHFYETFLREYNPQERKLRGVYYTPEPVVSYIIRSVDHILRTEFQMPLGLADRRAVILDPACGTGTFLVFAIRQIHQTITEKYGHGAWNDYVQTNLLGRLFGFELLVAPYTIAHLKLALELRDLGYDFPDNQRLGIYLTNTLVEAVKESHLLFGQAVAEEANAASAIKNEKPVMVVIGNPPYSLSSQNRSQWIGGLLDDYKEGLAERKLTLDDDYIKFLRFGEWRIEETGHGVLAYVTNDSYAHGIVHRRMRERIAGTFDKAHVLELHGDTLAPRSAPGGVADQNVFDIRPGVAVSMFLRKAHRDATPRLMHAEIWGQRHHKYEWLEQHDIADTPWQELPLRSPWFFFVPKNLDAQSEWDECVSVPRLFLSGASAIQTKRDELFIDIDRDELAERMRSVLGPQDDGRKAFAGLLMPTTGWAPDSLQDAVFSESAIAKVNYRPFDLRFIYYDPALLGRARFETQRHMLSPNVGLLVQRRIVGDAPHHFLCARSLCDLHTLGTAHSNAYLYPLYLYDSPRTDGGLVRRAMPRRPNLNAGIIGMFESQLGLSFVPDRHGDTIADGTLEFGPEDVLNYVYAMLHCPTYRQRYSEFLKINFPRVPITGDVERFRLLCALGGELVSIHLLEHPAIDSSPVKLDPAGSNEVGNVRYDEKGSRVYINAVQYFAPVEAEVYAFRVGAYQPLNKWLKDRKARRLSYDDIAHYSRMAFALRETIRLMEEIDRATPEWPVR